VVTRSWPLVRRAASVREMSPYGSRLRRCSRAGCGVAAVATLTYVYADSTAVVGPLATHAEPHCYVLCEAHAERLTAPRGWEVVRHEPADTDAVRPRTSDDLEALLDGSLELPGLTVDTDLRWALLTGLARAGRADDARIDAEQRQDNTISGQERGAAARASRPTALAKAEAWEIAVVRDDVPNETQRSVVLSFMQPAQEEFLEPYIEKYLQVADTLWEEKGTQRASTALEYLFPRPLASPELLEKVSTWLHESGANPSAKRYVREGAADVERYLAGQEKDAHG